MLFDESLHDAVARERHQVAEGRRHCEFDLPRRGLLVRWRARRAARLAAPASTATPARPPERGIPPIVRIRRTRPDMYR